MKEVLSNLFSSFIIGIERRWCEGLKGALGVAGAIWLITEMTTRVSQSANDWLNSNSDLYTLVVLVAAVIWFAFYSYEPRSVRFLIPTTDTTIEIRFGNLFHEKAHWLIGVNEFFDGDLGQRVERTSLHGQFIVSAYNGDSVKFRMEVDRALENFAAEKQPRPYEPFLSYPMGTTAVIRNGSHNVFLVAMAKTDLKTDKASTDVALLWTALRGAFHSILHHSNGNRVAIPLIGNGPSNVNIEPQHLLRLIVLALVDFVESLVCRSRCRLSFQVPVLINWISVKLDMTGRRPSHGIPQWNIYRVSCWRDERPDCFGHKVLPVIEGLA